MLPCHDLAPVVSEMTKDTFDGVVGVPVLLIEFFDVLFFNTVDNLRLTNLKRPVLHLAGPRDGRNVLARSRCSPTNTIVKKRYLCYVSSSFPTQNKMSN